MLGSPRNRPWRSLLWFGILLASLTWPSRALAHSGGPYLVLLEQIAGPYTISALADPDVGVGTFIVQATLSAGDPIPTDTEVTLWIQPEDGHATAAGYRAERQTTRDRERFVAKIPFDAEGMWQVRLVLDGSAGHGETAFQVRATPPRPEVGRDAALSLAFHRPGRLVADGCPPPAPALNPLHPAVPRRSKRWLLTNSGSCCIREMLSIFECVK